MATAFIILVQSLVRFAKVAGILGSENIELEALKSD